MIPKIIHYCWFGTSPKPIVFEKCLASWKKYVPDAQIIEWNEGNTDLSSIPFLESAYKHKKWAFVSDVVRLMAVYEMGGIYMDTDVELYGPIDDLLLNPMFIFFQNHFQINTGLGFGAEKHNPVVKAMLNDYIQLTFSPENLNSFTCPIRNTIAIKAALPWVELNGQTQENESIYIGSLQAYCRRAYHYGEFSWQDERQRAALKYAKKNRKFWKLREVLRNHKIFAFMEKHKLKRIQAIYTFLVYDFIDYGAIYWIYRIFQRLLKS